jgi:hypothetical protein
LMTVQGAGIGRSWNVALRTSTRARYARLAVLGVLRVPVAVAQLALGTFDLRDPAAVRIGAQIAPSTEQTQTL